MGVTFEVIHKVSNVTLGFQESFHPPVVEAPSYRRSFRFKYLDYSASRLGTERIKVSNCAPVARSFSLRYSLLVGVFGSEGRVAVILWVAFLSRYFSC